MDSMENTLDQFLEDLSALTLTENKDSHIGSLDVDPKMYGVIIGKGGSFIKSVQSSTETTVKIPTKGSTVSVIGASRESVCTAWKEILSRLNNVKTHILIIPINDEKFKEEFLKFKESFLLNCDKESRIKEEAFRDSDTAHLIISSLRLGDEKDIKNCIEKIDKFKKENADLFKTVKLHFKGIDFLEDVSAVKYLFAKPVDNVGLSHLLNFKQLVKEFLSKEKVNQQVDDRKMELHLLMMNYRYLRNNFPKIKDFDITGLIDKFGDWDFGELNVEELQLIQYNTDDVKIITKWAFDEDV